MINTQIFFLSSAIEFQIMGGDVMIFFKCLIGIRLVSLQ